MPRVHTKVYFISYCSLNYRAICKFAMYKVTKQFRTLYNIVNNYQYLRLTLNATIVMEKRRYKAKKFQR